ncbi:UDP-N-acetylmuramoyl-L-alanine--D-glutamate ligase [Chitinasiproducens palmae]|nr:UDP-N-acetylmuramoyl-L-alanine--D-glutamate ligase [Chitinasiproducens palmae]
MAHPTLPSVVTVSPFGALERPFVLVLGLGESGLAMARWCLRHGCRVRAADTREAPPMLAAFESRVASAEATDSAFVAGPFAAGLLDDIALVALSPGLSPLADGTASLLAEARLRGIPVWGEFEFFAQALRARAAEPDAPYRPRVLAVTGTNGKTTTCSMVARLAAHAGRSVALAGNISPALLDRLADADDAGTLPDVWVVEASSFQLESTQTFAPDAAAILNVTQDHLDWHGDFDAYRRAKGRIFGATTLRVLCRDDAAARGFAQPEVPCVTFGSDAPSRAGDFGIVEEGGVAWLAQAVAVEDAPETTKRRRRGSQAPEAAAPCESCELRRLMPVDALLVRGRHNALNAQAALALAQAIGLPLAALLHGLRTYAGEPHRVQLIATLDGVDYIDDSKGTNVGATVAALAGLGRPVWLIAGGDGKGQDFSPLAPAVQDVCRGVFLIGRDGAAIGAALSATGVAQQACDSLEAAVAAAAAVATAGEAVLMSPACASFDMFKSYAHRADVFRSAVAEHAAEMGVML